MGWLLFVHCVLRIYNQENVIFSLKKDKKVEEKVACAWLYN